MAQTISLMEPAQAQIRPKAFGMSMNNEAHAGTNLAFSTPSIALVWMLDVPEAGADWMFSIEERICRNGQTSGSAAVGRMLGRTQGASHDRLACGGRRLRDDLDAPSLHRYFCGRNAFYPLNDQSNPLISQQMRPPSGRTCPRLTIRIYDDSFPTLLRKVTTLFSSPIAILFASGGGSASSMFWL